MEHQTFKCGIALFTLVCGMNIALADTGHLLRFKRQTITDQQGFGYPVFNVLVPEKWEFSGQVQWSSVMGLPQCHLTYQVNSPDGKAQAQRYPEQIFHWSDNTNLLGAFQMNGAATAPPVGPQEFVEQILLPSMGKSQAQVTQTTGMDKLAQQQKQIQEMLLTQVYQSISPLPATPQLEAEAALVETQYNGSKEQFLVVLTRIHTSQPSMVGPINSVSWVAEVTSYKCPTADNDNYGQAFQVMLHSGQISPRWAVDCTRLVATCARDMLQTQQQIFARMRQIGQTQSEVSDMIMDGWQKRNDIMDGIHNRFSDTMRSSERYHDPIQDMEIDVPNLYENVWTNGLDYCMSDNPSFNPNLTESTQNWTQLERVR